MRIVQTFWSSYGNPTGYSYGWIKPEYNLMSWALSCLSLKKYYNKVELYTDSRGYEILIEKMGLPYSSAHIVFDDFECLPYHWAFSKIKTYSLQKEHFLHVDGDIFISRPFSSDVINGKIVAQNKEIVTEYYGRMMKRVINHGGIALPYSVNKCLKHRKLSSYNMGVFGGWDLDFIQDYCNEVSDFMKKNRMNDTSSRNCNVKCNPLFEQILFGSLVELSGKSVTCICNQLLKDNGYSSKDFCDLEHFEQKGFFHILGGHKKKLFHNELVAKTLFRLYPTYYDKVLKIISDNNSWFNDEHIIIHKESVSSSYLNFIYKTAEKWKELHNDDFLCFRKCSADLFKSIDKNGTLKEDVILFVNPYVNTIDLLQYNEGCSMESLQKIFGCPPFFPLKDIAIIPHIWSKGIKEIPILDIEHNIINLLHDGPMHYNELKQFFLLGYRNHKESVQIAIEQQIEGCIIKLLKEELLFVEPLMTNS